MRKLLSDSILDLAKCPNRKTYTFTFMCFPIGAHPKVQNWLWKPFLEVSCSLLPAPGVSCIFFYYCFMPFIAFLIAVFLLFCVVSCRFLLLFSSFLGQFGPFLPMQWFFSTGPCYDTYWWHLEMFDDLEWPLMTFDIVMMLMGWPYDSSDCLLFYICFMKVETYSENWENVHHPLCDTCLVSCVTCHMSSVACLVLHV